MGERKENKVVAEIQGTRSMRVVTRRKGHDVHMDIHVDVREMVREIERENEVGRTSQEATTEDQNTHCRHRRQTVHHAGPSRDAR